MTFNFNNDGIQATAKETPQVLPHKSPRKPPRKSPLKPIEPKRFNVPAVQPRRPFIAPHVDVPARNKRGFAFLNSDSDGDDDEDLFAFASKRNRPNVQAESQQMSQDESREMVTVTSQTSTYNSVAAVSIQKPEFTMTPVRITYSGRWLSKKMGDVSLKCEEEEIKEEGDVCDSKTLEWNEKARNAFGVQEFHLDISTCHSIEAQLSLTVNSTSGTKNFKTFVKKNNFKKQTQVIQTYPVIVSFDD